MPPADPMDFRVKTLEELKAEKSKLAVCGPHPYAATKGEKVEDRGGEDKSKPHPYAATKGEKVEDRGGEDKSKPHPYAATKGEKAEDRGGEDKSKPHPSASETAGDQSRPHPIATATRRERNSAAETTTDSTRSKKVVLVRRKMSSDLQQQPLLTQHCRRTSSTPSSPSKTQPNSIPPQPSSVPRQFGSGMRPGGVALGWKRTNDSEFDEPGTESKRRKLNSHVTTPICREGEKKGLVAKGRGTKYTECADEEMDVMVTANEEGGQIPQRKMSIAELRTEM